MNDVLSDPLHPMEGKTVCITTESNSNSFDTLELIGYKQHSLFM